MKNINKMRIIYSAEFNAEIEYLKTFFDYIGILVYDEKISDFQYKDVWYKHLKINNDPDGVDIVLNYYTNLNYYTDDSVPIPPYNKRIYLYFDLENKICDIATEPLPSSKKLLNNENMNISKKDLRSKVLDLLIDEIWQDDIQNIDAIKLIKECYIPKTEDSDLFYILQAIYSFIDVSSSYVVRERNAKGNEKENIVTKLPLNDYVKTIFLELWRVQCLLKYNNSPYAIYTTINNSELLLMLYSHLYESEKLTIPYISYNDSPIQINPYRDIQNQTYKLVNNYPWFTKAIFKELKMGIESRNIYNYLLDCISKSSFPYYYAPVYNALGYKYMKEGRNDKAIVEMFGKTLEINPYNYDANFNQGLLKTREEKLESGESYFKKILMNLGTNNIRIQDAKYRDLFSLSELLKSFQADIMISKIAINSYREYTARSCINEALLYAGYYEEIPLIERIADNDEKAYQDFMKYHKYSVPVWTLYFYLKPWVNTITRDYGSREILKKRLSKWVE